MAKITKQTAQNALLREYTLSKIFYTVTKTWLDPKGFRRYQVKYVTAAHSNITKLVAIALGQRYLADKDVVSSPSHPREIIDTLASVLELDVCEPYER